MNGAHLHLIVNHLPVGGTLFALGLLAYATFRRSDEAQKIALGSFVVVALTAILAFATGEPAEDALEHGSRELHGLIETHETVAGVALGFALAAGGVALAALAAPFVAAGRFAPIRPRLVQGVAGLGLVAAILMGATANLGGRIHHPEIRGPSTQ